MYIYIFHIIQASALEMQSWTHTKYKSIVSDICSRGGIWDDKILQEMRIKTKTDESMLSDTMEGLLKKQREEYGFEDEDETLEEKKVEEKVKIVPVNEIKRIDFEYDWVRSSFFSFTGKLIPLKYTVEVC
jgi:hypothetical protein